MSQLTLATEAGISTRHLSFLETGRAQPSREMVQLLAGMLDVPLGDRNALLVSAGYAPAYGERPLSAPELEPVRRALQFTLRQQEPFPALVVDGEWNIVMRNEASHRIFDLFDEPAADGERTCNVMRTVFDPEGPAPLHRQLGGARRVPGELAAPPGRGDRQRRDVRGCATSCSPTRACRRAGACPIRASRCRRWSACSCGRTTCR